MEGKQEKTMKKITILLLATLAFSCKPCEEKLQTEKQTITTILDNWHKAAAAADYETYFGAMSDESIFIGTDLDLIKAASKTGTDRVELYTEPYALGYPKERSSAVAPFTIAAETAHRFGLGVNAGHDLSLENLEWFAKKVPHLEEVSIGHALICDSLWYGLENTIQMYLRKLNP